MVDEPAPDDLDFHPLLGDFGLGPAETIRVHLDRAEGHGGCQARFLLKDWQETPVATFALRMGPGSAPRLELLARRPGVEVDCGPDRLKIGSVPADGPATAGAGAGIEGKAQGKDEYRSPEASWYKNDLQLCFFSAFLSESSAPQRSNWIFGVSRHLTYVLTTH